MNVNKTNGKPCPIKSHNVDGIRNEVPVWFFYWLSTNVRIDLWTMTLIDILRAHLEIIKQVTSVVFNLNSDLVRDGTSFYLLHYSFSLSISIETKTFNCALKVCPKVCRHFYLFYKNQAHGN